MNEHEITYRGPNAFDKIKSVKICVCGVGALGSNLVNILVRQGAENITIIDMDRVEAKNIATQIYTSKDVGQKKVNATKSLVYQSTKKVLNVIDKEVKQNNASKLLKGFDLIVDVFDNWEGRKILKKVSDKLNIPCVHAGMSDDGFAEIKWNKYYKIPLIETKQNDICDYPLAANLVHMTVAVLSEVIVQFVVNDEYVNKEITLKDISVHKI